MNIMFLIVFLFAIAVAQYPPFSEYVQDFHKSYNEIQYQFRKNIYQQRIQYFSTITAYTPGINNFTDWTNQEIARLSNISRKANPVSASKLEFKKKLAVQQSLDWRQKDAVTPPKNQLDCGSCTAFTAAGYAQSKLIIQGQYNNQNIDLSEQYILQCTDQLDCSGGYLENAMKTAYRLPTDEEYPYLAMKRDGSICSADGIEVANQNRDYYDASDEFMIELIQYGPLAISISADGLSFYESGIFQCDSTAQLNHALLIVGYSSDYWIVKNSWGEEWGQDGYARITRDRSNSKNCLIGTSVHILYQAQWQTKLSLMVSVLLIVYGAMAF